MVKVGKEKTVQTVHGRFDGATVILTEEAPTQVESQVLVTFLEGSLESAAAREERLQTSSDRLRPIHVYGEELRRQLRSQHQRFTVGAIMTRKIVTVLATVKVTSAINLMRQQGITSVLVEPETKTEAWGIMTVRDLLRQIVVANRSPEEVSVGEIATKPLICVKPELSLRDCGQLMIDSNIRRVVVAQDNQPIGIISDTDIFQIVQERGWGPEA